MIIGCDIGGVVRDLLNGDPIDEAIDTIRLLQNKGHNIIFISKCKFTQAKQITDWLLSYKLNDIPIHFCLEHHQKVDIAKQLGIQIMIDDKTQVLQHFDHLQYRLIWFCQEEKKIKGLKQYSFELYTTLTLCRSWNEILDTINTFITS